MKKAIAALALSVLVLAGAAPAAVNSETPATILVFPIFNAFPGIATLVSVTNVNTCPAFNPLSNQLYGDVYAHFFYVNGDDCDVIDKREFMSPGDTLLVNVADHNPEYFLDGFIYVIAEDPNTRKPFKFDGFFQISTMTYESGLIGKLQIANGLSPMLLSVPALGIKADPSLAWGTTLDGNQNQTLEFGSELEGMPSRLFITDFTEVGFLNSDSYLCVLTFQPHSVRVDLDYLFYNNDEVQWSGANSFRCWMKVSLADINMGVLNLNGAPAILPTGWAELSVEGGHNTTTNQPVPAGSIPILGVLLYSISRPTFTTMDLLHHSNDGIINGGVQFY